MIHSFISYEVPVATTVIRTATAPAAAAADPAAASAPVEASASAPMFLDGLKQLVLGVASKVTNAAATSVISDEASTAEANAEPQFTTITETVYEPRLVPAIVTTGQTFAIWLNVLYLAPLTFLFVKFFITSYLRLSGAESKRKGKDTRESQVAVAEKAGWDAARGIEAEVYGTPEDTANGHVNGSANGSTNGRVRKPVTNQQRSRYA